MTNPESKPALSADVPALPELPHCGVGALSSGEEAILRAWAQDYALAYGAACRAAAPAGDVQPVAPEQHAAMSRLIELAAECAQRKPLQAFVHLTDATHIGHRQFAAAHSEADDAVRILAIELRKVWDSLRTPTAAPAAQPAPLGLALEALDFGRRHAEPESVERMMYDAAHSGIAALSAPAPAAQAEPADPMDMPLPCDVKVGHGTHGKGTPLRSLVTRMRLLYDMAQEGASKSMQAATPAAPSVPPDHTALLRMLAQRARSFPSFPIGAHIPEVFAAIGEQPLDWLQVPAAPSVPPLPDDTIAAALADPACTRLREWAAIGPVQRAAVQSFADRLAAPSVPADEKPSRADLLAAVQFYADREHVIWTEESAWDTVSGEPQNWWCDEAGTAMIEDGTLAKMTLEGRMTAQHFAALKEGEDIDAAAPHPAQAPAEARTPTDGGATNG